MGWFTERNRLNEIILQQTQGKKWRETSLLSSRKAVWQYKITALYLFYFVWWRTLGLNVPFILLFFFKLWQQIVVHVISNGKCSNELLQWMFIKICGKKTEFHLIWNIVHNYEVTRAVKFSQCFWNRFLLSVNLNGEEVGSLVYKLNFCSIFFHWNADIKIV